MKIIGGAYREICGEPVRDQFFGSGVRAAIAISSASASLELITVATPEDQEIIETFAHGFGFTAWSERRPHQVQFLYPTPLSAPSLSPKDSSVVQLSAKDETVLAFGMVEANWAVEGTNVVIDPQGLTSVDSRIRWDARRAALVANRSETLAISKTGSSVELAGRAIIKRHGFDVVVVKCGALGAVVIERGGVSEVGVFPTQSVYPIGSGDVFSSVFAYCWGELGLPAADAARRASLGTAVWVSRAPMQILRPSGEVVNPDFLEERLIREPPIIYLAGPFFSIAQRWLVNTLREGLNDLGAKVISPLHDVGFGPSHNVAHADLEYLAKANGVIAILDELDPGTLFEVGYANARGIPIVGFASHVADEDLTMVTGTGIPIFKDLSSAAYQSIWRSSPA
jgi:hypothetical protein